MPDMKKWTRKPDWKIQPFPFSSDSLSNPTKLWFKSVSWGVFDFSSIMSEWEVGSERFPITSYSTSLHSPIHQQKVGCGLVKLGYAVESCFYSSKKTQVEKQKLKINRISRNQWLGLEMLYGCRAGLMLYFEKLKIMQINKWNHYAFFFIIITMRNEHIHAAWMWKAIFFIVK